MSALLDDLAVSPKQLAVIFDPAPKVVAEGAVRSGKTWSSVWAWLFWLLDVTPGPGELLVMIGKTQQTIEDNAVELIRGMLPGHLFQHTRGAKWCTIFGRPVQLVGANDAQAETKIRGKTILGAYADEVTTWPESMWMMLLSRLSPPGARLFASTNPDNPVHWLKKFLDRMAGDRAWARYHFTLDDNPHLTSEYKAQIRKEYAGVWFKRFILGLWVAAEGAIYDMFDGTRHVVDQLPPMRELWWVGVDYGTANPFAALLLGISDERLPRLQVVDEWRWDSARAMRQKTDLEYSAALRMWLLTAGPRLLHQRLAIAPRWVAVDPSAASFKAQLRRDGLTGVLDADNRVLDGIQAVSSILGADRLRIHRRCRGLLEELPGYVWDPAKAEKGEDAPLKQADHSLDALRYGTMAARAEWARWLRREQDAA
jgi:PBSX family phage terminase large subunit